MTEDEPRSRWRTSWYWLAVVGSIACVVALAGGGAAVVDSGTIESETVVGSLDRSSLEEGPLELDESSLKPITSQIVSDVAASAQRSSPSIERQFSLVSTQNTPSVPWESFPFELSFGPEALLDGASASAFWAWLNAGMLRTDPIPPSGQDRQSQSRPPVRRTGARDTRPGTGQVEVDAVQSATDPNSQVEPDAEMMLTMSAALLSFVGAGLLFYDWLHDSAFEEIEGEDPAEATTTTGESRAVTDRERVRSLLEDHGGRMRQKEIVEHVDWSKAKVSRVLSRLEEADEVVKLRLGRENLVCLPGHEPVAFQSPGRREDGTSDR